jgi:hypothetical protein
MCRAWSLNKFRRVYYFGGKDIRHEPVHATRCDVQKIFTYTTRDQLIMECVRACVRSRMILTLHAGVPAR